jgi:hypothetical protein
LVDAFIWAIRTVEIDQLAVATTECGGTGQIKAVRVATRFEERSILPCVSMGSLRRFRLLASKI